MATFKKIVGRRIELRRIDAGYTTQTALAKAMGINASRVSDWETGKREPKGDLKKTLLRLLNASEDEIFGIEEKPEPAPASAHLNLSDLSKDVESLTKLIEERLPPPMPTPIRKGFHAEPPDEVDKNWEAAGPKRQNICLYLLTGEDKYIRALRNEPKSHLLALSRILGPLPKKAHK